MLFYLYVLIADKVVRKFAHVILIKLPIFNCDLLLFVFNWARNVCGMVNSAIIISTEGVSKNT